MDLFIAKTLNRWYDRKGDSSLSNINFAATVIERTTRQSGQVVGRDRCGERGVSNFAHGVTRRGLPERSQRALDGERRPGPFASSGTCEYGTPNHVSCPCPNSIWCIGRTGLAGMQHAKTKCPTMSLSSPPGAAEVPAWASYLITTHPSLRSCRGERKVLLCSFPLYRE